MTNKILDEKGNIHLKLDDEICIIPRTELGHILEVNQDNQIPYQTTDAIIQDAIQYGSEHVLLDIIDYIPTQYWHAI